MRDQLKKGLLVFAALMTAFVCGRFTAPRDSIKTIENIKQAKDVNTDQVTHKETITTKQPNGAEETKIVEVTTRIAHTKEVNISSLSQTVTPTNTSKLNVSALVGTDLLSGFRPVYGVTVSRELIGPITLGVYGMTNSVVGLSIGLNF